MSRLFLPIILLVLVISAAACGDDDGGTSPTATADAGAPTAAEGDPSATPGGDGTAEPGATATVAFSGSRDPVEVPGEGAPGLLADVRAADQAGFDRIVFEFSEGTPGYRVQYLDEAVECGRGETVDVGALVERDDIALLEVHMTPANAHTEAGEPSFAQERVFLLDGVLGAVQTCDFEADVTWFVGVSQELDFTVTTLTDPYRIVIDIEQP